MKNVVLFFVISLSLPFLTYAQNNVGINTSTRDKSAVLDISSTDKGMLVPRMSQTQRNAIDDPATGLMIYQTDNNPGFYYNSGTPSSPNWVTVGGTGLSLPAQSGNEGKVLTTDGTNPAWITPATGGASLQLFVTSTQPQTRRPFAYGRYTFNFDQVVSGTNSASWTNNNTYTIPVGAGGLYNINLAIIETNYGSFANPVLVYPKIQVTSNGVIQYYYGTCGNASPLLQGDQTDHTTIGTPTEPISYARGIGNFTLPLKAGDKIKVFYRSGSSSSCTTCSLGFSTDGSSYLSIVKLD